MEFVFLGDQPKALPTIASWYSEEWGHTGKGTAIEEVIDELNSYLNTDKIPLIIMAVEKGEVIGATQLKHREMEIYPEKEHWLGGVFVLPKHRGKKIASKIIIELLTLAESLNITNLYLYTRNLNGGLYSSLGWKPIEQVNYNGKEALVMEKKIGL